mgnify:FL=1
MTIPTCPKCNTKTSEESQRWVQTDGWGEYLRYTFENLPDKYLGIKSYMCTNTRCLNDFFHFNRAEYKIPLVKI